MFWAEELEEEEEEGDGEQQQGIGGSGGAAASTPSAGHQAHGSDRDMQLTLPDELWQVRNCDGARWPPTARLCALGAVRSKAAAGPSNDAHDDDDSCMGVHAMPKHRYHAPQHLLSPMASCMSSNAHTSQGCPFQRHHR